MSMFDDNSYNEGVNVGKRIAAGSIVASLAVLAILSVTVMLNSNKRSSHNNGNNNANPYIKASEEQTEETPSDGNKRTSDELSFWNMYDDDKQEESLVVSGNRSRSSSSKSDKKRAIISANQVSNNSISDNTASLSENGFNISVSGDKPEYVSINAIIPKNDLLESGFRMVSGNRLTYSQGGRNISHFGIDVSKLLCCGLAQGGIPPER